MTLPLPALPELSRTPSHTWGRSPKRWETPALRSLLEGNGGVLASRPAEQGFGDEHLGVIKAGSLLALPALVIVAGEADVIIEQSERGNVLTGRRGSSNDCRLIFRHAYGRVQCVMRTTGSASDVHIGLLDHRRFDEVQTFCIQRPRGSRNDHRGTLWTTIEYQAEPLCELQGIMWRGGSLQIESLTLMP